MKISIHLLLATAFAFGPSLLANSQSLFPSDGTTPSVQQYLFTPKQPLGSIWQPLPAPLITRLTPARTLAPTRTDAAIYLQTPQGLQKNRSRPFFPAELPALQYKDLLRDDDGRLHLPVLSQPVDNSIRTLRPDNMPCLVPNLTRVERMPVDRRSNADRINHMSVRSGRMTKSSW